MTPTPPHRRQDPPRAGISGVLRLVAAAPARPLQARAAESGRHGRAKSVLVLLEQGGLSQMDTWDPKPEAVAEQRSPFKPIATNVPGIQFTELLGQTARVADKLAVVRGMYHPKAGANGHPDGTQYMLSGEGIPPARRRCRIWAVWPAMSSAVPVANCRLTSWSPATASRRP